MSRFILRNLVIYTYMYVNNTKNNFEIAGYYNFVFEAPAYLDLQSIRKFLGGLVQLDTADIGTGTKII